MNSSDIVLEKLCSACGESIKCHTRLAKAMCCICKSVFHRSCIAFLPMVENEKALSIKCPCCLFVEERLSTPQNSCISASTRNTSFPCSFIQRSVGEKYELAHMKFIKEGFYTFPSPVIHTKYIQSLRESVASLFDSCMKSFKAQKQVRSLKVGFQNFRERSVGRYEIVYPDLYHQICSIAVDSSPKHTRSFKETSKGRSKQAIWVPLIEDILGSNCKLMASGIFLATPGAKNQPFHMDGPPLSSNSDLPAHAINLFIPLVETGELNGTQIQIGSHLSHSSAAMDQDNEKSIKQPLRKKRIFAIPEVLPGGAFMFDYRVWHRGLANQTTESRPCIYFTFVKDWYADTHNFDAKRYRNKLSLPTDICSTSKD